MSLSEPIAYTMKLKAALLGCTLLSSTTAAQGQTYFDAEYPAAIENVQTPLHHRDYLPICKAIEEIVSPGFVFYPGRFLFFVGFSFFFNKHLFFLSGSAEFKADMSHWANSSSQTATCSVRPGKAEEVGKIVSSNSSPHWASSQH